MDELNEIIQEFLAESNEDLERIDRELLMLEEHLDDMDLVRSIFRCLHNIKGNSAFVPFSLLGQLAHAGENVLSPVRDGRVAVCPEIISALFQVTDVIRNIFENIAIKGNEGDNKYEAMLSDLSALASHIEPDTSTDNKPIDGNENNQGQNKSSDNIEVIPSAELEVVEDTYPAQEDYQHTAVSDKIIRVDVDQLDKLMTLVGELVLNRNQILRYMDEVEHGGLLGASQRLNLITSELQEGIMKTRMQPIKRVWQRLPRMVRDLSLANKKQIRLEMKGEETELDKSLIEAVAEPLTHLVRNAVDHGIELPEKRKILGKTAQGRILLHARHESGQVNVEIEDDGAGIDIQRVKTKVVERGLVTQDQIDHMTDREIVNLIFLPGLSTKDQVTNVSGRGVGMDVVKTNIEKIGGTVDVHSVFGQGATFKIKVPLTLAIVPALVITCGSSDYAIPQVNLVELVRLQGGNILKQIEMIHGVPVFRLRGDLLPLVYLHKVLGVADDLLDNPELDLESAQASIVVLQADGQLFGLVVSEVKDTQEIVVKPLGKQLKGITVYAGATIMGDGCVALILDVASLGHLANAVDLIAGGGVTPLKDRTDGSAGGAENNEAVGSAELSLILLFENPERETMAIPLSEVSRLERFSSSKIEHSGGQRVIQYRGNILPLVPLSWAFSEQVDDEFSGFKDEEKEIQVIVYTRENRSVGLVVTRILDIVTERLVVERTESTAGVAGSVIIQGKVTEMLDIEAVIRSVYPVFFNVA
jgi:two-component system chemotaxis sensor kinase CheA